jgi:Ca2+-transporting ATPase
MPSTDQASPLTPATSVVAYYSQDVDAVLGALGSSATDGLTAAEATTRLTRYGPNQITSEKPPSVWTVALQQLRDPMNIMLIAVAVVSLAIGEVPTA